MLIQSLTREVLSLIKCLMVKSLIAMAKIKIIQKKSKIGCNKRQKRTLEALGLRKISGKVEVEATPQILGMVKKVKHLVQVEELK